MLEPSPIVRWCAALGIAGLAACGDFTAAAETDTDPGSSSGVAEGTSTGGTTVPAGSAEGGGTTSSSGGEATSDSTTSSTTGSDSSADTTGESPETDSDAESSSSSSGGSSSSGSSSSSSSSGGDPMCEDLDVDACVDAEGCIWDPAPLGGDCIVDDGSNPCAPYALTCLVTPGCVLEGTSCVPA